MDEDRIMENGLPMSATRRLTGPYYKELSLATKLKDKFEVLRKSMEFKSWRNTIEIIEMFPKLLEYNISLLNFEDIPPRLLLQIWNAIPNPARLERNFTSLNYEDMPPKLLLQIWNRIPNSQRSVSKMRKSVIYEP
eukprot:TRINITY_DN15293_c0_g1_i1.p1 TRINITY_DN15293_c0_g1~~TRINITY_DN15293_c0_g1_i1.p1  ORF type:complete len:150 (-),score=9.29 TRINITY_DN15293_c0_g1_i1:49-456(-)